MSVPGIDVSNNNGTIDWVKVRRSGVRFAYIKVTEGDWHDPTAAHNARAARAAGLLVGAYCFLRPKPGRTGAQEADTFIAAARACGLLEPGCLRPVADVEATGRASGKPSRQYVYSFLDRMIAQTKHKPFVYTGSWFWDGVLGARNSHDCPLWLAAYTPGWKKLIPRAFKGVSIHQHTDKGRVPGIAGNVDLDRYLGPDVATLKRHHLIAPRKR